MTDRPLVALSLPAGPAWVSAVDAVWADGGAVLPLPPAAPAAIVNETLDALRPSRLVIPDGTRDLDGGEPVAAGSAVVIATSGSTGPPKGVVLSHDALRWSARASLERLDAGTAD